MHACMQSFILEYSPWLQSAQKVGCMLPVSLVIQYHIVMQGKNLTITKDDDGDDDMKNCNFNH